MKIETIKNERKKGKLFLKIKGTDEIFVNTVRRLVMEEVPTLAVEDLEIRDNNSALYDEMVGLRTGLAPIVTDLKSYSFKSACKCAGAGCAQCELKIELKAGKKGYVYAEEAKSADPKCSFAQPKMPLVKLMAKQKVDVTMTAVMGRGKDHTKWSPGLVYYKREPIIKVGKVADAAKIAKSCPVNIFSAKGSKLEIIDENVYNCTLCQQCVELDQNVTVEEGDNLLVYVESWGQLSCKEMLSCSADILIEKVEEMEQLLEKQEQK